MIRRNISTIYLLIIEIIFIALIILPFFSLHGRVAPFQAYFTMTICVSLVFLFILEKMKDKGKLLYLLLILPAILIVGNAVNLPLILNLLISFFIFWRTISNHYEHDKQNEGKWILATILLGTLELFILPSSELVLIKIMISQIVFILIGGFIKRWFELESTFNEKKQFMIPFSIVITFIGVVGLILTVNMNMFKWLFFTVLKMGVTILVFFAKPFFDWAEKQNWAEEIDKLTLNEGEELGGEPPSESEMIENEVIFDPMTIVFFIFIIGLALLFLYIYKRRKVSNEKDNSDHDFGYSSETTFFKRATSILRKGKSSPPADMIRKEIYTFEKFANKLQLGREPFESFSDWMIRLGMENYEDINTTYEKVRYGSAIYSENEATNFKNQLNLRKQELKEMQKK